MQQPALLASVPATMGNAPCQAHFISHAFHPPCLHPSLQYFSNMLPSACLAYGPGVLPQVGQLLQSGRVPLLEVSSCPLPVQH